MIGVMVAKAEEHEEVAFFRCTRDACDERWAVRSLTFEPAQLVLYRVRVFEDVGRAIAEVNQVALPDDGKSLDGNAVHDVAAFGPFVAPRDVVASAGRQNADVGMGGEMLGNVTRVQFGAAVDLRTVALHDHRDLHVRIGLRVRVGRVARFRRVHVF
jgi:hypothetical protein